MKRRNFELAAEEFDNSQTSIFIVMNSTFSFLNGDIQTKHQIEVRHLWDG